MPLFTLFDQRLRAERRAEYAPYGYMPRRFSLSVLLHAGDMKTRERRPGDLLLDRYFPHADAETRKRAREAFREYARVLEALGERIAQREHDSRESPLCDTIPPTT